MCLQILVVSLILNTPKINILILGISIMNKPTLLVNEKTTKSGLEPSNFTSFSYLHIIQKLIPQKANNYFLFLLDYISAQFFFFKKRNIEISIEMKLIINTKRLHFL